MLFRSYPCDATCMNCYELTNPDAAHTMTYVEAKAATCTENGNIAYYTCEHCGGCWDNEAGTGMPLNKKMIVTPMADHTYFYPCDATCMVCYELTNPDAAHSISFVEAKEATCTAVGNIAYYTCEHCGGCWDNEAATGMPLNKKMIVIPMVDHEYFYPCDATCMNCYELTNPDAAHSISFVAAKDATCSENGNVAYYTCEHCGGCWDNEAGTGMPLNKRMIVIPATGEHTYFYPCDATCMVCYELTNPDAAHSITYVEAKAATCTAIGNIAYYTCEHCGGCWDNANATGMPLNKKMIVIPRVDHEYFYPCDATCMNCYELTNPDAAHTITYVAAKDATCSENGNIAYYTCEHCNGCWDNEAGTGMPLNKRMIVIPATGEHVYDSDKDYTCNQCGQIRDGLTSDNAIGDVNGDDKVNNADLIILIRYYNNMDVEIDVIAADTNGDGTFTAADVLLMQQYLNGWAVELG